MPNKSTLGEASSMQVLFSFTKFHVIKQGLAQSPTLASHIKQNVELHEIHAF